MSHPERALASPPMTITSRIACRLGLHRWESQDRLVGDEIRSYSRCKKPGCPKYPHWQFVNAEPRPPWLTQLHD